MVLIFAIIGMTLVLIYPFLTSIITSAVTAYIFYPLYLKLKIRLKDRKGLASIITVILITILILMPFIAIINGLTTQAKDAYDLIKNSADSEMIQKASSVFQERFGVDVDLKDTFKSLINYITNLTTGFLASVPSKIIQISLFFFLLYYFLKEGSGITSTIKQLLPITDENKKKIITKVDELTKAIAYGSIVTAMIQGTLGGIIFAILQIENAIFWGFVMAIFALIPFVGTAVVWLPTAVIILIQGYTGEEAWVVAKGIGILIGGAFISTVDNFIKPYLIGDKSTLHPALVLIGILGGLSLMGFVGIIIGPIILVLFLSILEVYKSEIKEDKRKQ